MKHTIRPGNTAPIAIHAKEFAYLDASPDAIGTVSVPSEGVQQALVAGASYCFGNYVDKRTVIVTLTQGSVDVRVSQSGPPSGAWTPLTLPYTLTAADDQKCYAVTAAGTLTIPAGLSPRPSVSIMPPPTGNVTHAGQLTSTRSRASNPAGYVINPYQDSDAYGASGS